MSQNKPDKEKLKKCIGSKVRSERKKRNMDIDELAEMLNLTPSFIGLIERGYRGIDLSKLVHLADIFGLTVNDFIYPEYCVPRAMLKANDEQEETDTIIRKKTLDSIIYDFDDKELDFIISISKNYRVLRNENHE